MTSTSAGTAFYVAANARHFLGLVALINSLRLRDHDEPVYVSDCGLAPGQRRRLEEHAIIVEAEEARTPHLAKVATPLAYPSDVMVLIDGDIIVTRSLQELIARAVPGKLVAFADGVAHRFDERWSTLLGLGALRRQPYVNGGLVVMEREVGLPVLEQVAAGCSVVDVGHTVIADGSPDYPFYYLDQDVLNPVLATLPMHNLEFLEHRLAPFPPFDGLQIVDPSVVRCSYADGVEPYALHHIARKPWLALTHWSVYSELLSRLLLGQDLAISVSPREVPLRLRNGRLAWLEKRRSDAGASLHSLRGTLGLRSRLRHQLGRP